jgi:hypothetical protein
MCVLLFIMTRSRDFREATLTYKQNGHTIKQVCETFKINPKPTTTGKTKNNKQATSTQKNTAHEKEKSTIKNSNNI